MTVTPQQVAIAKKELDNIEAAAIATNEIQASFYQTCALLEKESGGRNVYGNDVGGVLSGFRASVTECNWQAFRHEVMIRGARSNGVGPAQLTYKGFFADMESKGLQPWEPLDNITYGLGLYWSYFRAMRAEGWSVKSSIRRAGTKYNSGKYGFIAYGDRLYELSQKWLKLVGTDDVPT